MSSTVYGSEVRRVQHREHEGKPAIVAIAVRTYDTSVEDLWEAITTRERIARWFMPIEGELKLGGRFQLIGNAAGTVLRCEAPTALDVSWEAMGATSWVHVRLAPAGKRATLTLEHIAPKDGIGEAHLKQFGPGAVGIGWDLGLYGLERHLANPSAELDRDAANAWVASDDGKAFMRASGAGWCDADAAAGEDPAEAKAKADRTFAAYTGG